MSKKNFRVIINMGDREREILDLCLQKHGKNQSEFIRSLIAKEYDRMFPPYNASVVKDKKVPEEELTNEQKCELRGGVVGTRNGIRVCIKSIGPSASRSVPLDIIDSFKDF